MLGICAFVIGTLVTSVTLGDPAESPAREAARSAFSRAEAAAKDLRFEEALSAYEEVAQKDPTAPFAAAARARAVELRAHSEGHFQPFAKLEAVRRDPAKNRDRATIESLERDARAFPDGPVRAEALLVVSQAYEHAFSEPARALAALEPILTDPFADRGTRALALSEAVSLYRARGDLPAALAAVSRDPELLPSVTREVRNEVRRVTIGRVCLGILALIATLGLRGAVRAARRTGDVRALPPLVFRPGALAFAFYVGGGGAVFVRLHGTGGDPMPFLLLGAGIALLGALIRLVSLGDPRSRLHAIAGAALGVVGVLAMAYLVLWRSNGAYLSPLGL